MFIVRRDLGDEEKKLLGHVHAHEVLFGKIGIAVGIGENDLDDVASAA
jgi:hypothetical protein